MLSSQRETRSTSAQRQEILTSNKRTLSPESTDNLSKAKKSKATNLTKAEMDELKKLIASSTNSIQSKIDESQKSLEIKFNQLASNVNSDVQSLKSSVDDFKAEITSEISDVKIKLTDNTLRIDNAEDDIERLKRSQDLRLTGFAPKDNENLLSYIAQIAKVINYEPLTATNTPTVERIPVKNKTTGQIMESNTILIHFPVVRQKQIFYSCYLNKMPLDPEKFKLTADNRIILGENLTKKNAQIFKSAQLLRKNKKIAQTFTEDGLVKIRLKKGKQETAHTIRNNVELDVLIAQYELTQATVNNTSEQHNKANTNTNSKTNTSTDEAIVEEQSKVNSDESTKTNSIEKSSAANSNADANQNVNEADRMET